MKVIVTGAGGQLARGLAASAPHDIELLALGRAELDVTDGDSVEKVLARERPEWVINAAAYTDVDRAEGECEVAHAVNAEAPRTLARAVAAYRGRLLQVSTDFVFAGDQSRPYRPDDSVAPLNVYGTTKAAGERAVAELLPDRHLIVRTAWLYDRHGRNFVTTMLRLMKERREVTVVDDQIGTPTHAPGLARALWRAIARGLAGVHHWTDAGVASWYDFACAIQEIGVAQGLVDSSVTVRPIPSRQFPTRARRPAYSVLDKSQTWDVLGVTAAHWRDALVACLASR